ncbi:hypothetical protein [Streptomyces lunaelactis]|uniref:hypothetical protein n=1 Tax=Streptomyces lunaelactis TaxID=1535768 RepID=UPI001584E9F3|nr:hypothetical protein [Streptomyces lunaelactis]NUK23493.1 hypothetical protein [Streptomyces lunaelactis]
MSEPATPEEVEQQVQEVNAWYAEQILEERRAGSPDPERLKTLKEGLAACAADRQALQDADEDVVAEIAARYAARLKELGGQ